MVIIFQLVGGIENCKKSDSITKVKHVLLLRKLPIENCPGPSYQSERKRENLRRVFSQQGKLDSSSRLEKTTQKKQHDKNNSKDLHSPLYTLSE